MSTLVMTKIPDGRQVNRFTDKQIVESSKFIMKNLKNLVYAIENIEVPDNLTAKGLLDFTVAAKRNPNSDVTLKSDLI